MLDQIKQKAARFDQIEKLIQDPAVTSQPAQYAALMKERGQLLKSVQPFKELESIQKQKAEAQALLADPDMKSETEAEVVRTDTYSAGGPGGQHVNKTQSAVRLTHLPTNIVVQCQDQRSQTRNRELAWKALKSKLYEHFEELKAKERRDLRRTQVGTGDRNEKIRTYNFPDSRVTDVRL